MDSVDGYLRKAEVPQWGRCRSVWAISLRDKSPELIKATQQLPVNDLAHFTLPVRCRADRMDPTRRSVRRAPSPTDVAAIKLKRRACPPCAGSAPNNGVRAPTDKWAQWEQVNHPLSSEYIYTLQCVPTTTAFLTASLINARKNVM